MQHGGFSGQLCQMTWAYLCWDIVFEVKDVKGNRTVDSKFDYPGPSHWGSLGFQIVPTRINKGRTHLIPHVFWKLPWNLKKIVGKYLSWRLWSGFCFPNDNFALSLFISWSYPVISRSNVLGWLNQSTHFACGEYCCSSLWYIQQNYVLKKQRLP